MHAVPFTLLLAASSSVAQIGFSSPAAAAPSPSPAFLSPAPQAAESPVPAASVDTPPATPSAKPSAPSASPSAAPPAASASPGGQPPSAALPRDRAANLIGGVWQCETLAGNTGTHTYAENDDGSIDVSIELHAGYRTFAIRESYRYDDARKLWTARTAGGAYVGTAPPWTGYKWTFDGTAQERGARRAVRMVYFDLADQAFRRDFQAKQDGAWKTYSAETCRRPSN